MVRGMGIRPVGPLDAASLAPIFEQARHALTEAKTTDEVKRIRDQAQAIQAYLHQQRASLGMINDATEIKLRAERRLGEMLAETVHPGGDRQGTKAFSHDARMDNGRLPEGVTFSQSSRWQQIAAVPEEQFEALLSEIKDKQERLTTNGVLREINTRADRPLPTLPPGVFDVILADPPWAYDNQIADWGPTSLHYPSLALESIKGLEADLSSHVAHDATLFLWVPSPFLPDAYEVMKAWGFTYKALIVWVKTNLKRPGVGFYVRNHHEFLFIGTRGSHVPDQRGREPISSVLEADVQEHSRKPEKAYEVIEAMYPEARRLELFARGVARPGWTTWGDQADG